MDRNTLNIFQWNCNSLFNKQTQFFNFISFFKPDIIILNETKLSKERFESELYIKNLSNYNFLHKHREEFINGAGGVAILVKKVLNIKNFLN